LGLLLGPLRNSSRVRLVGIEREILSCKCYLGSQY
jgi:hypothetical protein